MSSLTARRRLPAASPVRSTREIIPPLPRQPGSSAPVEWGAAYRIEVRLAAPRPCDPDEEDTRLRDEGAQLVADIEAALGARRMGGDRGEAGVRCDAEMWIGTAADGGKALYSAPSLRVDFLGADDDDARAVRDAVVREVRLTIPVPDDGDFAPLLSVLSIDADDGTEYTLAVSG